MSKKGIVVAIIVVVLIGAGAGVYFFMPAKIEIKDSFAVGDKHTIVRETKGSFEITEINEEGGNKLFELEHSYGTWSESDSYTYNELVIEIKSVLIFNEDITDATSEELRIDTDFGKRDCIMYALSKEFGDFEYYVGKDNELVYKTTFKSETYEETFELKKSNMFIESQNEVTIKTANSLKVGDKIPFTESRSDWDEIEEVIPADGDTPELYRFKGDSFYLTREEVLSMLLISIPEEVLEGAELKGTKNVETFLGRVTCDVYTYTEALVKTEVYVCNDIFVMIEHEYGSMYWSNSDIIVKSWIPF